MSHQSISPARAGLKETGGGFDMVVVNVTSAAIVVRHTQCDFKENIYFLLSVYTLINGYILIVHVYPFNL